MYFLSENSIDYRSFKNNKFLFLASLALVFPVLYFMLNIDLSVRYTVLVFSIPLLLIFLFSYETTFILFIVSIFLSFTYYFFAIAEVFVIFVFVSLLLSYKFKRDELSNPLTVPFFIFLLSVLPSFINNKAIFQSSLLFYHMLAFFVLFTFIPLTIKSYDQIKKYLDIYLAMACLNGLHIVYLAITTGKRVFGFSGIMFVDLVGIGLAISFYSLLFNPKSRKIYGLVTFILFAALIFTQTRNSWITSGLVMIFILIDFIRKSPSLGFSRARVYMGSIFVVIIMVVLVLVLQQLNPGTFSRLSNSDSAKSTEQVYASITDINSFATRFFIWHTAFNAFLAHPVLGIGFYSFRFTSELYSTIDPLLYKLFVQDLPPHTTVLCIMAETGLVGVFGFTVFMMAVLRFIRGAQKKSKTSEQRFFSSIIFWMQIYIIVSMVMTDAWLWGNLMMLWGVILAFAISNSRFISGNGPILSWKDILPQIRNNS